jgi:rod shape-determining protein MreC
VAHSFETIYGYMYKYEQLMKENDELKKQISDLRQDYREYTEVAEENVRLHELLNMPARRSKASYESAMVLEWSSNFLSTFTIDKGSDNSAAKVGDAITSATGVLIGRITEVRSNESVCVSVVDTTFAAGVHVGELGATGVAEGDFTLMHEGKLKLTFGTDPTTILVGDSVVTSGSGGKFPDGLVIGTVTAVMRNEAGIGMYAVITPATELRDATYVYFETNAAAEK